MPQLRRLYGANPVLREADDPQHFTTALKAYFAGDFEALGGLPIDGGGTPFERRVRAVLLTVPAGRTRSYGWVAAQIGMPQAARAVGRANGRNPINIVVPCHRIVGATGALTGYGGGVERKGWLLAHEAPASA